MTLIRGLRRRVITLFNPGTLQLNTWFRDYNGTQYTGVASTGSSGTRNGTLAAGTQPSVGTLSGFNTSVWTQGAGSVITTSTASNVLFPNPTTSGFVATLFNASTANAPGASRYNGIGVWSDTLTYNGSLYMGLAVNTTGPSAYLYNGGSYSQANSTGSYTIWYAVFQWWDGANLYIQINNGAPVSIACAAISISASSNPVCLGKGYPSAALSFGGSIAEWMTSPNDLSASIPNIYSYFKGRYPAAGLP